MDHVLVIALPVVAIALWVWAVIDVLRVPSPIWRASGRSRPVWLALVIVFPFGGALVHLLLVRPRLAAFRTAQATADRAVTITRLTPDEWRTWRAMRLRALTTDPSAFDASLADWSGDNDLEERWRARLTTVPFNVVARLDGVDVGQVSGVGPDDEGRYELISMWVSPDARRHRVGVALVRSVLTWAKRQGATSIDLRVRPDNLAARTLYERCGFVADSSRVHDSCDWMTRRP